MATGVIANSSALFLGGIIGSLIGTRMDDKLKDLITNILGVCAICMGIPSIVKMQHLPVVVLSVLIGTLIGVAIKLERFIANCGTMMQKGISKIIKTPARIPQQQFETMIATIAVIFCTSGTGLYGSLISGMTGDNSILLTKSILDFSVATIFACTLGPVTSFLAVPQFIIFYSLYLLAGVIVPNCTPGMLGDFVACGGFIMVATGLSISKIKQLPLAVLIPSLVIVMPISYLWTALFK